MRALWAAVADLTRLPVPGARRPFGAEERARGVPWYPLVGLALGAAVALVGAILQELPRFLAGALTTAVWVGLTGAMTLQGLATVADAVLGGGPAERMRAAMRSPGGGAAAVAATVLAVLAKTAAVGCLAGAGAWTALAAAPVAGRTLLPAVLAITPPARDGGEPPGFAARLDRAAVLLGALGGVALLAILLRGPGVLLALVLAALAVALRALLKRFLGGADRSVLLAITEAGELAALAAAVGGAGCG